MHCARLLVVASLKAAQVDQSIVAHDKYGCTNKQTNRHGKRKAILVPAGCALVHTRLVLCKQTRKAYLSSLLLCTDPMYNNVLKLVVFRIGCHLWWAICFKLVDSKNAVCAPKNRDYIDSMVNKIDSICTTFDSIIRGGVKWIHATFDSIIHGGKNQLDFMKIELIRVDSCHVRLDHPRWRKLTRFAQ